ncbi:MAG: AmmeMemoRadiSam system protein B [Acidobacteriota bacterium]
MSEVRPAAVAGLFYPGSARELRPLVEQYLQLDSTSRPAPSAKAIIAPHAGYVYSGQIAASAFRCFLQDRDTIRRIVLIGPAHRVPVDGVALPGATGFDTPLGTVPIDPEWSARIIDMPQVSSSQEAHAPEHCLEVELPFLQVLLGEFSILPLLVSDVSAADLADVVERIWGGQETRFVISSDLSHYMSYEVARELDRETALQVVDMHGHVASRVVGYGAFAFVEASLRPTTTLGLNWARYFWVSLDRA